MIEIRVRDNKTCAVCDVNSFGNECATVENVTPQQATAIKAMVDEQYQAGRRFALLDARCKLLELQ
jgi:hypothetical protein